MATIVDLENLQNETDVHRHHHRHHRHRRRHRHHYQQSSDDDSDDPNDLDTIMAQVRTQFVLKVYGYLAQLVALTFATLFAFIMVIRFSGTYVWLPKLAQVLLRTLLSISLRDLLISVAITVALSLVAIGIAYFNAIDFTLLLDSQCILFMLLFTLPVGSFCMMLIPNNLVMVILWCAFVVINVMLHMVINNQLIFGGGRYEFSYDNYLLGAVIQYSEMMAILMYILPLICTNLRKPIKYD